MESLEMRSKMQSWNGVPGCCSAVDSSGNSSHELTALPMPLRPRDKWNEPVARWRTGGFYKDLSASEMSDFESLATPFWCGGATAVFTEEQEARYILFLLEGRVKLTMSSTEGKRLSLGIAGPGEILGLASVIIGSSYEMTAVAQFPCRILALTRTLFLNFLLRHPAACQNAARLLGVESARAGAQLRILGLTSTASVKLARLLLQWSAEGQQTRLGARIRCSLTHQEIGEFIGVSRETVTRNLTNFKNNKLLQQHGSTFLIPSLSALEDYAGQFDS